MKFIPTQFFKHAGKSVAFLTLLGTTLSLTSCMKNDVQPPEEISAMSVINASPKNASIDFFLNDRIFGYTTVPYGTEKIGYFRALPGTNNGKVRAANDSKILKNANFDLIKGKYHSLFILSQADTLSYLVVPDDVVQENGGNKTMAKIRFGNLSSDSPSYNLELQGDTTSFKDRTFKTFTRFRNVPPSKYTILLKDKATNTTVATLNNVEVLADKFYTIWAKGFVNTTTDAQKLGIQVSVHL